MEYISYICPQAINTKLISPKTNKLTTYEKLYYSSTKVPIAI